MRLPGIQSPLALPRCPLSCRDRAARNTPVDAPKLTRLVQPVKCHCQLSPNSKPALFAPPIEVVVHPIAAHAEDRIQGHPTAVTSNSVTRHGWLRAVGLGLEILACMLARSPTTLVIVPRSVGLLTSYRTLEILCRRLRRLRPTGDLLHPRKP